MEISLTEKQRADIKALVEELRRAQIEHSQAEGEVRRLEIQLDSQDRVAKLHWEAAQQATLAVKILLRGVVADSRHDPDQPWRLDVERGVLTSDSDLAAAVTADDTGIN